MTDVATATTPSPARPLPTVAFVAVKTITHLLKPVRIAETAWIVGYLVGKIDHAGAAEVMHHLIGDFDDVTTPSDDLQQILTLAITSAPNPRAAADKLMIAIIDAATTADPWSGLQDWAPADRASNDLYRAADRLIAETFRRHVEAAPDRRQAARDMLVSLVASVQLGADAARRAPVPDGAR